MCGIAGYALRSDMYEPALLRKMADVITHRGPDDEGFYHSFASNKNYHIGLAHRRLSIIDLHSGHQPIGNEDESIHIVFNGEIYNYQSLRSDLISKGHYFKTDSDTETIVTIPQLQDKKLSNDEVKLKNKTKTQKEGEHHNNYKELKNTDNKLAESIWPKEEGELTIKDLTFQIKETKNELHTQIQEDITKFREKDSDNISQQ